MCNWLSNQLDLILLTGEPGLVLNTQRHEVSMSSTVHALSISEAKIIFDTVNVYILQKYREIQFTLIYFEKYQIIRLELEPENFGIWLKQLKW